MKVSPKLKPCPQCYLCRIISGDNGNRPVVTVPGNQSPRMTGVPYHAESRTGIKAGMAALKRFWSTYHYVASTLQTEVGADWLASRRNVGAIHMQDGVRAIVMPGRVMRAGNVRVMPGWTSGRTRIYLCLRGNRSYHAIRQGKLAAMTREAATEAANLARAGWARQDEAARQRKAMDRDLATTRVTIHDARRAGNCMVGILNFAERKLRVSRETALSSHFAVPALTLRRLANGAGAAVERAIQAAYARETMVSI